MNAYFENFNDEINQIISRSKKDKNITIFRIQKSRIPYIHHKNNEVKENRIETLFGVNLHLISKDGYMIYGASNRVHIPDVLSRLYQNLENLIKANKGHKVNKSIVISELPKEQTSAINYSDVAEINFDYLNGCLRNIYDELDESIKEKLNIELIFDGNYSLWYIGNSLGGNTEHDDFHLNLKCNLSLKTNPEKKISLTQIIKVEELRKNEIKCECIHRAITFYYKLLTSETVDLKKDDLKPEAIILDKTLTSLLFTNLISGANSHSIAKDLIFSNPNDLDVSGSMFDNFGVNLNSKENFDKFLKTPLIPELFLEEEKSKKSFKQNRFYQPPVMIHRDLHIANSKKDLDGFVVDVDNLNESIKELKKILKVKNILFLAGYKEEPTHSDNSHLNLASTLTIYFDDELRYIEGSYILKMDDIEEISLLVAKDYNLLNFISSETHIHTSGYDGAVLKIKNNKVTKERISKVQLKTKVTSQTSK